QGVEEIAEPGNDKADHQRGEDPREVGAEVKQAAGQTAQPLRGDIGDQRPAETHHPLAKKGKRHHQDHRQVALQPVGGDDAAGHQQAGNDRQLTTEVG
ncbi:hypothetical protein C5U11_19990, partial [Acinetobacter baumannii]